MKLFVILTTSMPPRQTMTTITRTIEVAPGTHRGAVFDWTRREMARAGGEAAAQGVVVFFSAEPAFIAGVPDA